MMTRADRRLSQEEDERAQQRLQNARPNEPPDVRAPHPWDATPEEPCTGVRRQHDYTRKNHDGLRRCWYCSRLSPRSRAELAARSKS